MAKRTRKKNGWGKYLLIDLILVALIAAYFVFGPNTGSFTEGQYLYIRTGSKYDDVLKALKDGNYIRDIKSFDLLAKQAGYPKKVRAGKYHITKGMSNYSIVRMLRGGKQTPVKLVITKLRTKDDFVRLVARNLEADSPTLRHMLSDGSYLGQFGLDSGTAMCAVMPDTYEFYWNTTADNVFRTIEKNYAKYWTSARKEKATQKGLTPSKAVILASIVEEETNNTAEKGNVASVYLNRLEKGMRLQADPTARFAGGNFAIKRVTSAETGIASPYNTYYVSGLPIGPICTPSGTTIEAVLNAPTTPYLYFVAKADGSGTHTFSTNYSDHQKASKTLHEHYNDKGIH